VILRYKKTGGGKGAWGVEVKSHKTTKLPLMRQLRGKKKKKPGQKKTPGLGSSRIKMGGELKGGGKKGPRK